MTAAEMEDQVVIDDGATPAEAVELIAASATKQHDDMLSELYTIAEELNGDKSLDLGDDVFTRFQLEPERRIDDWRTWVDNDIRRVWATLPTAARLLAFISLKPVADAESEQEASHGVSRQLEVRGDQRSRIAQVTGSQVQERQVR